MANLQQIVTLDGDVDGGGALPDSLSGTFVLCVAKKVDFPAGHRATRQRLQLLSLREDQLFEYVRDVTWRLRNNLSFCTRDGDNSVSAWEDQSRRVVGSQVTDLHACHSPI